MLKLTIIVPVYNCATLVEQCLNSIELIPEIEIIIIDDCSTDDSLRCIRNWIARQTFPNITLIANPTNLGAGATVNKGYDCAQGEYVMTLCDDDRLLVPISELISHLTGEDLVYYDLVTSVGKRHSGPTLPGSTKAYKRTIIGPTRRPNQNFGGDKVFYDQILAKNPTKKSTGLLLYYYNRPRQGSLMWQWESGLPETAHSTIDITIYTTAYNGYGKFLPQFTATVTAQTLPARGLVVLGPNHGATPADIANATNAGITILYNTETATMGAMHNMALETITTEWVLRIDIDDQLHPHATKEIQRKSQYDVVALQYTKITAPSAPAASAPSYLCIDTPLNWKRTHTPGYLAHKRCAQGHTIRHPDTDVPNFPLAFLFWQIGATQTHTDIPCALYIRRPDSHAAQTSKSQRAKYTEYIDAQAANAVRLRLGTGTGTSTPLLTVFTIMYNGYGRFLPQWCATMAAQTTPVCATIVLGRAHGATELEIATARTAPNVNIIIADTEDTMGTLLRIAARATTTSWALRVDADDILMPHAAAHIAQMAPKYDAIGLMYRKVTPRGQHIGPPAHSAIFPKLSDILKWRKKYELPGYLACRTHFYAQHPYEETEIPNYPFLFELAATATPVRWGQTSLVCVKCVKYPDSHGHTALASGTFAENYAVATQAKAQRIFEDSLPDTVPARVLRPTRFGSQYLSKGDTIDLPKEEFLLHLAAKEVA